MGWRGIFALAFAGCLAAQDTTFRTGISIVEIDAQVIDRGGVVEGLKLEDFAVTDNRQPVALRYCVQEETPLDVVLLFELSEMMAPNRMKLRGAAEASLAAMRPGDRVGAASFNENAWLEVPVTSDLAEVRRRVRLGLAYATFTKKPFVLNAVPDTAKILAALPRPHGRRAVVMFGANAGWGVTMQTHMGMAADLWNADTILSGVVIPTSWTRLLDDPNPYVIFGLMGIPEIPRFDSINDVAEYTGGEMIYTDDSGLIRATANPYVEMQRMIGRIRRRYRLYYDMPDAKAGARRRVEIALTPGAQALHPGARVVGRKGYVVPKRGGNP